MLLTEFTESTSSSSSPPQVRVRLLEQMAEALEDEAAVLYRRAAAFEEDEFLLNREIEQRQTEINRLQLKLDAMRAERDRVMEKIETISEEASAMRDRVMEKVETISEEASAMRDQAFNRDLDRNSAVDDPNVETQQETVFFRRAALEQPVMS